MPVLPEVESRMVRPGTSRPRATPSSTIFFAGRSFTEPPRLKPSSLPKMRTPGATPSRTLRISTRGVLPIRSSGDERRRGPSVGMSGRPASDACADMTASRADRALSPPGDGGHDRQLVARLERRIQVLQETDVLAVHEDVHEATDLPGLVADAIFHPRVALLEVVDQRGDRGAV